MPKVHRLTDDRIDGATTLAGPANVLQNVLVNNLPISLRGDLDTHDMLGAIITQSPGTVLVNNIPIAVALMDNASPDAIGLIFHPQGMPIPAKGSENVTAYGGAGSFAGGLGSFGLSGMPMVGEIMKLSGIDIGTVMGSYGIGGYSGVMVMNNLANMIPFDVGQTLVGGSTGRTFSFSNLYSS